MTAGELKEWIAVFLPDLAQDGAGGFVETVPAGLVADTPAKVTIAGAATVYSGEQLAARVSHTITIRYQDWLTINYRVMWRDVLLDITGLKNLDDAGDAWLELSCTRREAGAQL